MYQSYQEMHLQYFIEIVQRMGKMMGPEKEKGRGEWFYERIVRKERGEKREHKN